jgi:Rod binding domain-containing protein
MHCIGTATAIPANGQTGTTPQPRLVRAAHEFEAQMMKELLKPMTASDGLDGDEDNASLGSNGALGEFASEALGRALSEHGGLGIAESIVHSLSKPGNGSHSAKVTGNIHGNTMRRNGEGLVECTDVPINPVRREVNGHS